MSDAEGYPLKLPTRMSRVDPLSKSPEPPLPHPPNCDTIDLDRYTIRTSTPHRTSKHSEKLTLRIRATRRRATLCFPALWCIIAWFLQLPLHEGGLAARGVYFRVLRGFRCKKKAQRFRALSTEKNPQWLINLGLAQVELRRRGPRLCKMCQKNPAEFSGFCGDCYNKLKESKKTPASKRWLVALPFLRIGR
jgi:hypothetical protein